MNDEHLSFAQRCEQVTREFAEEYSDIVEDPIVAASLVTLSSHMGVAAAVLLNLENMAPEIRAKREEVKRAMGMLDEIKERGVMH